jgi:hypothetical protein
MRLARVSNLRIAWASVIGCLLAACAAEVPRDPAPAPVQATVSRTIQLTRDSEVKLPTDYLRTLRRDSRWTQVGRISQGEVFKAVDGVFTVEGAHVHEAYLVLAEDVLVGFYLPVERAFSPLAARVRLSFR